MSVEVKGENDKLIHKVVLQAGWGAWGLERGLTPLHLRSSFQIASLVRHFDRNEITVWASENSSVMRKCKAAVSSFALPAPAAPSSRSWNPA